MVRTQEVFLVDDFSFVTGLPTRGDEGDITADGRFAIGTEDRIVTEKYFLPTGRAMAVSVRACGFHSCNHDFHRLDDIASLGPLTPAGRPK